MRLKPASLGRLTLAGKLYYRTGGCKAMSVGDASKDLAKIYYRQSLPPDALSINHTYS